jgi:hypothetical protein
VHGGDELAMTGGLCLIVASGVGAQGQKAAKNKFKISRSEKEKKRKLMFFLLARLL